MASRALLLNLRSDVVQAWRRATAAGRTRLFSAVVAGLAFVTAEIWIANRIAIHLLLLPDPFDALARVGLQHLVVLVVQLALVAATASALTIALPTIERLEGDPWWAACPLPSSIKALQCWWRVFAGLLWVVALAVPPACFLSPEIRDQPLQALWLLGGVLSLLGVASALGCILAMVLASLVPKRVLVPLSWSGTTLAIVGAVVGLRRLQPERLTFDTDPAQMVEWLSRAGSLLEHTGPLARLASSASGTASPLPALLSVAVSIAILLLVWRVFARRTGGRLIVESSQEKRSFLPWRFIDLVLTRSTTGTFLASRARLLTRDASQGGQTLYLIGLGAVYVENLRALPLGEPLAIELAGLINLAMAALLLVALALRFAYPARLLEEASHWWWSTGPTSRVVADLVMAFVAALPAVVLASALFAASTLVTGPTLAAQQGWWMIPWLAFWLCGLGLALGPPLASPHHRSWLDAALGGGGLLYLALAVVGAGICVVAAGRQVIARVIVELGGKWDPGALLDRPVLLAVLLTCGMVATYSARILGRPASG